MGFEVLYKYHERKEDGTYDTEEKKELKKKVGKAYDDTPVEKVAKAILGQLARRDIWVVDVELKELVKREVSFKESKDGRGIVIKGKKFTVDSTEGIEVEEYSDEGTVQQVQTNVATIMSAPDLRSATINKELPPVNQSRVIFKVMFTPEIRHIPEIKNLALTKEKTYPVHRQRENPKGGQFGSLYTISDDKNTPIEIDEKYFTIAPQGLIGGAEFNKDLNKPSEPSLMYQDNMHTSHIPRKIDRSQIPAEFSHLPIEGEDVPVDVGIPDIRPDYKPVP